MAVLKSRLGSSLTFGSSEESTKKTLLFKSNTHKAAPMAALSLKNKQRSIALVSLLFCSSALAATLEQPIGESHVRIINSLEQCVSFGLPVWGEIDSVPLLTIKANLMNSIADCGCKSALAGYTSLEGQGAESRVLYSGKFSMLASGIKSLQLGTKGSSKTENVPLTLAVGCAQPD